MLAQQQRVRGDLHGVRLFRFAFALGTAPGRAAFVVNDFRAIRPALHDVHHADEAERFAFQPQAAELRALRQTEFLGIIQPGRRIHIAMDMAAGHRVRVLLKNVFNPLEIKQARAIDEIVKPTHRQRRLQFQSALGLNRGVAHGLHGNVVFLVWW